VPQLSAFDEACLVFLFFGWWASYALAFLNPYYIYCLRVGTRSKFHHMVFWAVYVGAGLALGVHGFEWGKHSEAWLIPVFGVPILAISHFAVLAFLLVRARIQTRLKNANDQ
jgi:hypothetical protein